MSTPEYTKLELVGRHIPDPGGGPFNNMSEAQAAGHDTLNPVTGMYEFGALVDGVFVPLVAEKASLIFDRVEIGKQQQAAQQQQTQQTQPTQQQTQPNEG